jgi:O-antigen ligase
VITLGQNGIVGLTALMTTLLLPPIYFMWRFPAGRWREPQLAVPAVIAVVLVLHMADNLLNSFANPVFMMMAGGLVGAMTFNRTELMTPLESKTPPPVQTPQSKRPRRCAGEMPALRRGEHPSSMQTGDSP